MKHSLSIATSIVLGLALTLTACGKDKKPAEPAKTEPAVAAPAAPAPAAPAPAAAAPADPAKAADKKDDKGGW